MQQFYAMFLKRALYSWRNWKVMVAQFLVPLVFTVLALVVARTLPGRHNTPQLKLSLDRYGPTHVPVALEPTAGPLAVALAQAYSSQLPEQRATPNNVTGQNSSGKGGPVYLHGLMGCLCLCGGHVCTLGSQRKRIKTGKILPSAVKFLRPLVHLVNLVGL